MSHRILVINPGSTSTKVAVYEDDTPVFEREVRHDKNELARFDSVAAQRDFRLGVIEEILKAEGVDPLSMDAIAGRGGLTGPLAGGTYEVNQPMLDDLAGACFGEHPCNLGAPLAALLAERAGIKAFITDPVVTDEMIDEARLTGLPEIPRRSVFHALNQRAAARKAGARLGMQYEDARLIVCHLGGGISIGAHDRGRIADVINALDGEGPMSPERTGGLPVIPVIELLESGRYTSAELRTTVLRQGGVYAYLGTNDMREVERIMEAGDEKAKLVFSALGYMIAKAAASLAPALNGGASSPHAVVLTGGMARSERLTNEITGRLKYLAPVVILPGEREMAALAAGAVRVLDGLEQPKIYAPNS